MLDAFSYQQHGSVLLKPSTEQHTAQQVELHLPYSQIEQDSYFGAYCPAVPLVMAHTRAEWSTDWSGASQYSLQGLRECSSQTAGNFNGTGTAPVLLSGLGFKRGRDEDNIMRGSIETPWACTPPSASPTHCSCHSSREQQSTLQSPCCTSYQTSFASSQTSWQHPSPPFNLPRFIPSLEEVCLAPPSKKPRFTAPSYSTAIFSLSTTPCNTYVTTNMCCPEAPACHAIVLAPPFFAPIGNGLAVSAAQHLPCLDAHAPYSLPVGLQPMQHTTLALPPAFPAPCLQQQVQLATTPQLSALGAFPGSLVTNVPATVPAQGPAPFFAACCRLLGYKQHSTVALALHCWGRLLGMAAQFEVVMCRWFAPTVNHMYPQYLGVCDSCWAMRPGDAGRATALVLLWAVAKCEEERKSLVGANRAVSLLPAACVHGGAARVCEVEVALMQLLDWSPYRGMTGHATLECH